MQMEVSAALSKSERNTVSGPGMESTMCEYLQWQITKCTQQSVFMNKAARIGCPASSFFFLSLRTHLVQVLGIHITKMKFSLSKKGKLRNAQF